MTFVIGNAHRISASILAPGTTISATIANEFTEAVGDLYTSSLIALGLILFVITFIVLAIARYMLLRIEQRDRMTPSTTDRLRRAAAATTSLDGAVAGRDAVRSRLAGADPRRAAVGRLQRAVARGVHRDDAAAGRRRRPAQSRSWAAW